MAHMRPDVARLARLLRPPETMNPFQLKESAGRKNRVVLPKRMLAVSGTRANRGTVPPGQYESPWVGSPVGQTLGEGSGAGSTPGARAKKRKASPPDTVPSVKKPSKPNLDSRRVKAMASATFATKGKPTSLIQPQPWAEVHPFTPTLKGWRHGIDVDCSPDWDWVVIKAAVTRGPHPTATTPNAIALFKEDITYQVKAGFSWVMLWEDLQRLHPTNLKILPVAVVPQTGHQGCIILNLSFPVYQEVDGVVTATQESVNGTTVIKSPSIPVKEIDKVLPRMLQYMRDTPAGLHILFSKLDISDGFWRLTVQEYNSYNFAYVLPQEASEPFWIVIPAAVQMGWVESPALFCMVVESA
jgi:hypothetical protein